MKKSFKEKNFIKSFIVGACLLLTGCGTIGLAQEAAFESAYENTPVEEEKVDIFTSEGYGVIEKVNPEAEEVTVYLENRKEQRTFQYDTATLVMDKHGSSLSMEQLVPGEVVSVAYNSELEKLGRVRISTDSWNFEQVDKFKLDVEKGVVNIGNNTYSMGSNLRVFSDGKMIEADQLLKQDILSFNGMGHDVLSVTVEKGHGYLDLANDEALVGGWIEIGQTNISRITEDMLITVPEGQYTVRVTAGDIDETREVTIERDKETVLSFSNIKIPKAMNGAVTFQVTPKEATVYVDDVLIDAAYSVKLPYGIHKITAEAEGYDTLSQYFDVKEDVEITTVKMSLDVAKEEEKTVSGNGTGEEYTITVQAPEDVEVYQDNLYMGIAPVTYEKKAGDHVITLRKNGYVTRSHSIYVEDDERNLIYSFPDLEKDDDNNNNNGTTKKKDNGNSVSDNSVSGNSVSGNVVAEEEEEDDDDDDDRVVITESVSARTFVSGNN